MEEKYNIIKKFLVECLEVEEETASADSKAMVEVISEATIGQMELWLEAAAAFDASMEELQKNC